MVNEYPLRFPAQLRQHLRALRKARTLTQAQLGEIVGVSQARIAEIEANPGLVSLEQLMRLLSALGVTLSLSEDPSARSAPAGLHATPPSGPGATATGAPAATAHVYGSKDQSQPAPAVVRDKGAKYAPTAVSRKTRAAKPNADIEPAWSVSSYSKKGTW